MCPNAGNMGFLYALKVPIFHLVVPITEETNVITAKLCYDVYAGSPRTAYEH